MRVPSSLRALIVLFVVHSIAGCGGGDGLPREKISGSITLDGDPLASGDITFSSANPSGTPTPVAALIANGSYSVASGEGPVPGPYNVSISSTRQEPPKPGTPQVAQPGDGSEPPMRELVPAKYNTRTTLKAEVVEGGKNVFDFTLTTK